MYLIRGEETKDPLPVGETKTRLGGQGERGRSIRLVVGVPDPIPQSVDRQVADFSIKKDKEAPLAAELPFHYLCS